jgi:putative SOS response-associated peptidase YedK
MLLAAVWDINVDATAHPIESLSIVTVPANDLVGTVHPRIACVAD